MLITEVFASSAVGVYIVETMWRNQKYSLIMKKIEK